jgi:DNA-binding transcriptional ArsR family regulator
MWTLLDGKAFTATELAITADTSPQNMSMHLTKLVRAGLLCVESQGRHRYYKFSGKEIAYAIEAMANLIPHPIAAKNPVTEDISPIKYCRSCYDHLAGRVGVLITDSLLQQKIIVNRNNVLEVSNKGHKWFYGLDIPVGNLKQQRRFFVRPCLDWSERRHHIAGSLAASLLDKMLSSDWLRKTKDPRAIMVTGVGRKKLYDYFKISV